MFNPNQIAAIETAMAEEHRLDREALRRLKRFLPVSSNNDGHAPLTLHRSEQSEAEDRRSLEELIADAEEDAPRTIIDTVEQVMLANTSQKWSVPSMIAHLKSAGFKLQAKKPEATMGLVFQKLAKKRKTIVRVRRGSGRTPNLYRAIPREHQEDSSSSDIQNERAAS